MTPAYDHGGVSIYAGSCLDVLPQLAAESVQMVMTSPPFYALRSYLPDDHADKPLELGSEPTPAAYLATMVRVFREVRRVIKPTGTVWLEIGDSYVGGGTSGQTNVGQRYRKGDGSDPSRFRKDAIPGLRPKSLLLIPQRLAVALSDDGWIARSVIIWHKPSAMPESVGDRPTTAHSYVLLLAKQERYLYDGPAIAEPAETVWEFSQASRIQRVLASGGALTGGTGSGISSGSTRNKRSVWTVPTEPLRDEHYAAFPTALVRPCILAGSRPGDVVLDPFSGSGTTLLVSKQLERKALGIELNPAYVAMAARRCQQDVLGLFGDAAGA